MVDAPPESWDHLKNDVLQSHTATPAILKVTTKATSEAVLSRNQENKKQNEQETKDNLTLQPKVTTLSSPVIAIAGAAGSGKDTVADYLCRFKGYSRYSLADPLRRGLVSMIPELTMNHMLDRDLKERPVEPYGKSPRELLQSLGTEWGREMVWQDIWLHIAIAETSALAVSGPVVIPDVRFPNELKLLDELGAVVVWVDREVPDVASHKSEGALDGMEFDYVIDNNRSYVELLQSIDLITSQWLERGHKPFDRSQ
jgi:hypothetical protein